MHGKISPELFARIISHFCLCMNKPYYALNLNYPIEITNLTFIIVARVERENHRSIPFSFLSQTEQTEDYDQKVCLHP